VPAELSHTLMAWTDGTAAPDGYVPLWRLANGTTVGRRRGDWWRPERVTREAEGALVDSSYRRIPWSYDVRVDGAAWAWWPVWIVWALVYGAGRLNGYAKRLAWRAGALRTPDGYVLRWRDLRGAR